MGGVEVRGRGPGAAGLAADDLAAVDPAEQLRNLGDHHQRPYEPGAPHRKRKASNNF